MRIIKKYASLLIALVLIFSTTFNGLAEIATASVADKDEPTKSEANLSNNNGTLNVEDRFKTEISMLNYLTVVTQEIKANKNRLLLDSTYNTLYDGIHLDAVDNKTQIYIKELANTVFELKMLDIKRSRIEYLWEQERAGAIKSAIPNPIGLLSAVRSADLFSLVTSGSYMIIDSVVGYNDAINRAKVEYLKNGWEIDDAELIDINVLNGNLWDYKNDMRRDNKIPSDLILNEDKIKEFVKWEHYDNVDSKISFFEENIETYKGYPTLWLVLAQCYYDKAISNTSEDGNGILKEYLVKCIDAVKKYETNSARIFIKDSHLAKIIPLVIASAEKTQSDSEYVKTAKHYVELLEKNMKNSDWDLQYFAAQTYVDIYGRTKDIEYLKKAYNKTKNNVVNLVPEQRKMNKEYNADFVEQKPKERATKKEKDEIKEFNKKRKEERDYEMAPIMESLKLNLDLLFELSKELKIDENEKKTIDNILHTDNEPLFIFLPLDNYYWFNLPEEDKDIDYGKYIETSGKDSFNIPIWCFGQNSDIRATYSNDDNTKTYDLWTYHVDRKDKKVFVTLGIVDEKLLEKNNYDVNSITKLKGIDFKVNKETKMHVDFNPVGDEDSKVYTADFVNDGWIGIFNGFERVN